MKRAAMVVLLMCGIAVCGSSAEGLSTVAVLRSGRTFLPLRDICQWLGEEVGYSAGSITITGQGISLRLTVGSAQAVLNGQTVALDAPVFEIQGVSYAPVRFMAESFGAQVECPSPCRMLTMRREADEVSVTVVVDRGDRLTYQGAWFDIDYPRGFRALERERSGSASGYDSASFLSPDGSIEFFVYSPQWSGTTYWTSLGPGETEASRTQSVEGNLHYTRVMITGPGGAYQRAWVEVRDTLTNTNHIFGIKYADQAAYDRYRDAYLHFKDSLVQYAD